VNRKRILIAGVGNVFLKDDGFAAEVVKRLAEKERRPGVELRDFGTGGLKLAYDLLNGYDGLILIDAAQRQEAPGTLYLIEPNFDDIPSELTEGGPIDPHGADTGTILRFVKGLGAWPGKVLIVGCEPAALDDFAMGLSDPVRAAVERAVQLVEETIGDLMREGKELTHEPAGG